MEGIQEWKRCKSGRHAARMSEGKNLSSGNSSSMDEGSMAIQGNISKRGNTRLIMNTDCMGWKRVVFKEANAPERQTVQLSNLVHNFKPMTKHRQDEGRGEEHQKGQGFG